MSAGGEETASDEEMDRMPVYTGRDEMRPLRPVRLPAGALKSMVPNILLGAIALGLMSLLVVVVSLGIPLVYYQANPPASAGGGSDYTLPENVPFLASPADVCPGGLLGQAGRVLTCLPFSAENTTVSLTLQSIGGGVPLAVNATTNVRSLVSNSSLIGVVQDGNTALLHGELPDAVVETCAPCAEGEILVQSGGACFSCANQTAQAQLESTGVGVPLAVNGTHQVKSLFASGSGGLGVVGVNSTVYLTLDAPTYIANGTLSPVVTATPGLVVVTVDQQAGVLPVLGPCVPGQTTRLAAGGTSLECFNVAATSVITGGPGVNAQARVNDTLISEEPWSSTGGTPTLASLNLGSLSIARFTYKTISWPAAFPGGHPTLTTNDLLAVFTVDLSPTAASAAFSMDMSALITNAGTPTFATWASSGQLTCGITANLGTLADPGAFIAPISFASPSQVPELAYAYLPVVTPGESYTCGGSVRMLYYHA